MHAKEARCGRSATARSTRKRSALRPPMCGASWSTRRRSRRGSGPTRGSTPRSEAVCSSGSPTVRSAGHRPRGRPQPAPELALARATRRRLRAGARRTVASHDRARRRAGRHARAHHGVAVGPGAWRRVTERDPDPVFEALADPTRRAMIEALSDDGPTTLSDLTRRFPVTRQAVAKHLSVLQGAGLVDSSGPVRGRMYSFTPQPLTDAMTWIVDVGAGWDERLARLKRQVEHRA